MSDKIREYKYKSLTDFKKEFVSSFKDVFEPFFNSYRKERKNFCLQSINFVLLFIFLQLILKPVWDLFLVSISGSSGLSMRLLLTALTIYLVSTFKKFKPLKWQTLFDTEYKITKRIMVIFASLNIFSYLIKEFYVGKQEK